MSLAACVYLLGSDAVAQTKLAPDQNPNFAASRDKYMKMADSLNEWHSTTFQDTYKAIDWLADRKEARVDRREFRRQLRTERVRFNSSYDNYYPYYRNNWGSYNNYYNNRVYRRFGSYNRGFWGLDYWWR